MGAEELLQEESFTNSLIERLLTCYDTMWGGQAGHDVPNPYTRRTEPAQLFFMLDRQEKMF
jgi:hypothetical protein